MIARFSLILFSLGLLFVALSPGALAQAAPTPAPIPAAKCANAPITYARMSAIIAARVATPEALPDEVANLTPGLLPPGKPADEATSDAIHTRILVLTACINAGDLLRTLALYSDRFLSKAFAGQPVTEAAYTAELGKTNPRPAGSEVVLYGFSGVVIVADGRAVVSVLGNDLSSERGPSYTLFYFAHEDNEWRIDATYDVGSDQPPG